MATDDRCGVTPTLESAEALADAWAPSWRDWVDLVLIADNSIRPHVCDAPIRWDRTREVIEAWREELLADVDADGSVWGPTVVILRVVPEQAHCPVCRRTFTPRRPGVAQVFCDAECRRVDVLARRRAKRAATRAAMPLTCQACGAQFPRPDHAGRPPAWCPPCRL